MPDNNLPYLSNLLSIQQAAKLLKVSTKTLRRWEAQGILTAHRTPGNQRRYQLGKLLTFSKKKPAGRIYVSIPFFPFLQYSRFTQARIIPFSSRVGRNYQLHHPPPGKKLGFRHLLHSLSGCWIDTTWPNGHPFICRACHPGWYGWLHLSGERARCIFKGIGGQRKPDRPEHHLQPGSRKRYHHQFRSNPYHLRHRRGHGIPGANRGYQSYSW